MSIITSGWCTYCGRDGTFFFFVIGSVLMFDKVSFFFLFMDLPSSSQFLPPITAAPMVEPTHQIWPPRDESLKVMDLVAGAQTWNGGFGGTVVVGWHGEGPREAAGG